MPEVIGDDDVVCKSGRNLLDGEKCFVKISDVTLRFKLTNKEFGDYIMYIKNHHCPGKLRKQSSEYLEVGDRVDVNRIVFVF